MIKMTCAAILLGSGLMGLHPQQAFVQRRNPPGNYADTCNLCDWTGEYFHCRCDKIDQTWIETGLYYNQVCKWHTLQNIDGHLKCDPTIAPEFRHLFPGR